VKRINSRADAQKQAELAALAALSQVIGRSLQGKRLLIEGCTLDVDGFNETDQQITLVEVWAHIGSAKPAQKDKVLKDILKLTLLMRLFERNRPRCTVESYLLFIDDEAARHLQGSSWAAAALREFNIHTKVVPIDTHLRDAVQQAQVLQDIRN
jgi:hypothetical protein